MRLPRLPVSRRRHDMLHGVCTLVEREAEVRTEERDEARARVAELEQAIRTFVASEDTHEPGPFVKDGNWHPGPCVEGGPELRVEYPHGFQVCADEECFAYWPCDVERLRRVLDGHDRQERGLPSVQDIVGSDPERTGDMTSAEYIRWVRGDQEADG